jgi:sec-independent protein translocase protein TatA
MGKVEIILLIVAVVLVLMVGGKKLPELARGIGQAGKELRRGFTEDDKSDKSSK